MGGRAGLAVGLAAMLLLVSIGGAGFYLLTRPSEDNGGDGDDGGESEPSKNETVEQPITINCDDDEIPIYDTQSSDVVGCRPMQPPSNASFGSDSITITRGEDGNLNWSIDGDREFEIATTCSDSAANLYHSSEEHVNSPQGELDELDKWTYRGVELGTSLCIAKISNPADSTNLIIQIIVVDNPPQNVGYTPSAFILTKGEPVTLTPTYSGGDAETWMADPTLPPGLQIRDDGTIIGAPTTLMPATTYTIQAANSGGKATTELTLSVHDQPPTEITYVDEELLLTKGVEMNPMTPSHAGGEVVTWQIEPALPAGLVFSTQSGRISGTPSVVTAANTHYIYANNSGGFAVTIINITVNDIAVDLIDYGSDELDLLFAISEVDITPQTSGGTPLNWSISPPLPEGLNFAASSGRIFGNATTLHPWTNHTIWSNNSGGSFSTWLNIRIANMTPDNISWLGGEEFVLAANQSVTITAVNNGPAIDSWEADPPLPDGLHIFSDGTITGTPMGRNGVNLSRHAWTTHTIWANNSGGTHRTNLTFAIHDLAQDHRELAKREVGVVNYGGSWPSLILPIGEWAFSLGVDWDGRPIASAAHSGKGRIVGYGHETMVARSGDDSLGNLSLNSLDWVCDGNGKTVGLESSFNGWQNTLLNKGYAVVTSATPADLANLDCFVTEFWNSYSDSENSAITTWLQDGGGMIMGGHAWYWSYSNSDAAHNYPGNKIAKQTGLFVSTTSGSATFEVNQQEWGDLYRLHGSLPLIIDHVDGTQMMSQNDADIAAKTVTLCVSNLPLDYTGVWDSLWKMSNDTGWIHIDSNNQYSMNADEVDDLILTIQESLMLRLPADQLEAHPSHVSFPGQVAPTAPRVSRMVEVNGTFAGLPSQFGYAGAGAAGRMSTGLYAAAGEVVNITVPPNVIGQGVNILVGAHTDSLWGKSSLSRHPRITRGWTVDNTTTQVANSFGGTIYITVAKGSTLGLFNVSIENAVEMPHYIHGVSNLSDWQNTTRNAPAPSAELQSDWFILTVPSSGIRNLDDPDEAMNFWDEALQMEHNLSGYTPWPRVERAVFDVQISAGWMHSGYPFMAHTASVSAVVNGSHMRANGDWGMFHELGHNHQWMSSTLPGTTETTCNLYSVKLMTDLVGKDLRAGHSALNNASMKNRVESYFNGGSQISQWSVWTALETYLQIQEEFGWEPITAAYQEYYYNLTSQPSGSDAEFNEYAKWISLKTGHNLTSFLAAWGWPISAATMTAVDHLPVWNSDPLRGWVHEYDAETRNEMTLNIGATKADLEWSVWDNGTNTTWEVCWGQTDGGNSSANWDSCDTITSNLPSGTQTYGLTSLVPQTTYYWRLTVVNGNGRWWDEASRQFTTT